MPKSGFSMADNDDKGQPGDQNGQGDKTANNGGENKGESERDENGFTKEQQDYINSLVAEERRKEGAKAKKLQKELDTLRGKKSDGDNTKQAEARITALEGELAKFKARDVADKICADLKIAKEEREKYIRHVTATDEDEIRDQIKALKQDFAPKKTGTGSNPAKTGKPGKNDSINRFIRSRGRITE